MGRRGPPSTPLKVLRDRGSWLGDLNPDAPEPPPGAPRCPPWLDATAKACWKDTVKNLDTMGLLATTDGKALAGFCERWSFYVRVVKVLTAMDDDQLVANKPLMMIGSVAFKDYLRGCQEFGLTPSARARVRVPEKRKADKGKGRFFKEAN